MDPKLPKPGELHIDASDIQTVDLTPDDIRTLSKLRPGYEVAIECVLRQSPELLERAGVSAATLQRFSDLAATDKRCKEMLPASEKLTELLYETSLHTRHELAGLISEVAAQARRRAERDPKGSELLAALEEVIDYQCGPAVKAAATREKAKEGKDGDKPGAPPTS